MDFDSGVRVAMRPTQIFEVAEDVPLSDARRVRLDDIALCPAT